MDNASDYGSEDSRFESWRARTRNFFCYHIYSKSDNKYRGKRLHFVQMWQSGVTKIETHTLTLTLTLNPYVNSNVNPNLNPNPRTHTNISHLDKYYNRNQT